MNTNKMIVLLVVAAPAVAFVAFDLGRYLSLDYLKQSQDAFADLYARQPLPVALGFFVIYVTVTALSFPGAAILTLAGGAIFGLLWGTVIVSFASSLGATLAFLVSRFILRDSVESKFGNRLAEVNRGIEKDGAFYLFTLVLGYGAAALVGPEKILSAAGKENSAAPLLAFELGGVVLLGIISAVAFATILAVVAGLAITASASFAHDIYASVIKRNKVSEDDQVRVSRYTIVVLGVLGIVLGILANGQNIAFLVALAFAVAASANLPTILYSLFWKGFNTKGALWSIYGGLISSIGLIIFSPVVSGKPAVATKRADVTSAMLSPSMFTNPDIDFHWFPLQNPGLVSIPLAFLLGIIGTLTSSERGDRTVNAEMEVRSLTGVGAAGAVAH